MPVSSQARHIKISNDILSQAIGKHRSETEGFGPFLLQNRRLENLMSTASGNSPIFCRALRRLTLPVDHIEPENVSSPKRSVMPKLLLSPSVNGINGIRPQSASVYRGTPNRSNSVTEPLELDMCARGSALLARETHKPCQGTRMSRTWSAGAVKGVHYSRPVSATNSSSPKEGAPRQIQSQRPRAPLLNLHSERRGEQAKLGAQLHLRPRIVSMPLSARQGGQAAMQPSPSHHNPPFPSILAEEPAPDGLSPSRDPAGPKAGALPPDDMVFDYVSLTIE
jgi:hypothetical protein